MRRQAFRISANSKHATSVSARQPRKQEWTQAQSEFRKVSSTFFNNVLITSLFSCKLNAHNPRSFSKSAAWYENELYKSFKVQQKFLFLSAINKPKIARLGSMRIELGTKSQRNHGMHSHVERRQSHTRI